MNWLKVERKMMTMTRKEINRYWLEWDLDAAPLSTRNNVMARYEALGGCAREL